MIRLSGKGIATTADIERWIADYVRQHENGPQKELVKAAKPALGISDRTARGYVARLDELLIKRVRDGRETRLQSLEYWRRHQERTFDLRVPHTGKLMPVLDMFRGQVPFVHDDGLRTVLGTEYRPDIRLEFEGHVLFDDLLFHLGLLTLGANPSVAWLEFKGLASRFIAARDALWAHCTDTASTELRLPLGGAWKGEQLSEHCVALFYRHALAAARNETERDDLFQDAKVELTGDAMEYWLGGRGILRRPAKRAVHVDEMARRVTAKLKQALKRVERPHSLELANLVVDSLNQLRAVRERLVSTLKEASYYEVFPGTCRFTELS